jgi:hypothetical protein
VDAFSIDPFLRASIKHIGVRCTLLFGVFIALAHHPSRLFGMIAYIALDYGVCKCCYRGTATPQWHIIASVASFLHQIRDYHWVLYEPNPHSVKESTTRSRVCTFRSVGSVDPSSWQWRLFPAHPPHTQQSWHSSPRIDILKRRKCRTSTGSGAEGLKRGGQKRRTHYKSRRRKRRGSSMMVTPDEESAPARSSSSSCVTASSTTTTIMRCCPTTRLRDNLEDLDETICR